MPTSTISASAPITLIARLLAARLEDDGAISLRIAHPDDPAHIAHVSFPPPGGDPAGEQARRAFVTMCKQPSFEGFDRLYGHAQLTLLPFAHRAAADLPTALGYVRAFAAVTDDARLPAAPRPLAA